MVEKKFTLDSPSTGNAPFVHRFSTVLLDELPLATYSGNLLKSVRTVSGAVLLVCLCCLARPAAAQHDATEFRVFLKDGTSLVSFGELARVDDRVVFSIPTTLSTEPDLQLVNLSADHVDWEKTDRYTDSVRSARYMETQGEAHYAMLTAEIAQAINDVQATTDPRQRLAIVERARRTLTDWPAAHYNYRQAEIGHMISMLDEAIVELRAQAGIQRFDLSFVASVAEPSPAREPLLPRATLRDIIEQVLTASRLSESSVERVSLMSTALAIVEHDADILPSDWRTQIRRSTHAAITMEIATDRAYQTLTSRTLDLAGQRAKAADVRGVERLMSDVRQRDEQLGKKRPEAVTSLLAAIDAELDAARRLRLELDRWALREPELRRYRMAVLTPLQRLDNLKPSLDNIKSLAGSGPWALANIDRTTRAVLKVMSALEPPAELQAAHALLLSALRMAQNAAQIRREAALTGSIARAWDASAAAAGSMMLTARARTEIQDALRPPQFQP